MQSTLILHFFFADDVPDIDGQGIWDMLNDTDSGGNRKSGMAQN